MLDRGQNLSDYRCTIGSAQVADAVACVLYTAMTGAGFAQTAIAETQIQTTGKDLTSANAVDSFGANQVPRCADW